VTLFAFVAIWVRSYSSFDTLSVIHRFGDPDVAGHGFTTVSISWSLGSLSFFGGTILDRLPPDDDRVTWSSFPTARLIVRDSPWLKFRSNYSSRPDRPTGWSRGTIVRRWGVTIPWWVATGVASALPALWAMRKLRARGAARRIAQGRCARCGYDIRMSPGLCPECGTVAPRAPARAPVAAAV